MHDTMEWLASFFPKWGGRALGIAIIFAVAGTTCRWIGDAASPFSRTLLCLAGIAFVAFVLMAAFWAFRI